MRQHPAQGARLVALSLGRVATIVRQHHERHDGTGTPTVAPARTSPSRRASWRSDTWAAMLADRCYRLALSRRPHARSWPLRAAASSTHRSWTRSSSFKAAMPSVSCAEPTNVVSAMLRPPPCNGGSPARGEWAGGRRRSFHWSFHHGLPATTGVHWLDEAPDLTCQDGTRQHSPGGCPLSCKQQVGGSSLPAGACRTTGPRPPHRRDLRAIRWRSSPRPRAPLSWWQWWYSPSWALTCWTLRAPGCSSKRLSPRRGGRAEVGWCWPIASPGVSTGWGPGLSGNRPYPGPMPGASYYAEAFAPMSGRCPPG